jgi:hypothetical protein
MSILAEFHVNGLQVPLNIITMSRSVRVYNVFADIHFLHFGWKSDKARRSSFYRMYIIKKPAVWGLLFALRCEICTKPAFSQGDCYKHAFGIFGLYIQLYGNEWCLIPSFHILVTCFCGLSFFYTYTYFQPNEKYKGAHSSTHCLRKR